jgi:hemerythrin-like domain-containing protein
MKRAPELIRLSRDHYHALEVARRLRRAEPESLAEALTRLEEYLRTRGERHFDIEEEVFTPELCAEDPRWSPGVERMLREHEEIRARAAAADDLAAAHALGDALHDHVRFEERELFVIVEETLAPDALARIEARLEPVPE